jgi:hypothetical protein
LYLYADDNGALENSKAQRERWQHRNPGKVRLRESANGHRNRFNGIDSKEKITEKEEAFEQKPDQTDIKL